MSRASLLTAFGGVVLAATLITGVGFVAAQQGPKAAVAAGDTPDAPPKSAPDAPKPAQPDPKNPPLEVDVKLKKLERFAESLKSEIEAAESQLEKATRTWGTDESRVTAVQKQLADIEAELNRTNLELTRLEAEVVVLKKVGDDKKRVDEIEVKIQIVKEIRDRLNSERDLLKRLPNTTDGGATVTAMRKSLDPQRELLVRVQREILIVRAQRDGITFTDATGTDAKLDVILRELAALRREVQELKDRQKVPK